MGLFVKRSEIGNNLPLYRIGAEKTLLVAGLGNPGAEYSQTRHNIGFAVADKLVEAEKGSWHEKKTLKCHIAELKLGDKRVIVIKPTTFMNNSGESLIAVQQYYKIPSSDTLVLHDELDIAFGSIRSSFGGSSAGHNGLKSIITLIGLDFQRLRIGIGPKSPAEIDSADFVLAKFSKEEQSKLKPIIIESLTMINDFVFGSLKPETRKI